MLAMGLASSVLLDATVVRLFLVPAVMNRLGEASWWMPEWLDRIITSVDPEGKASALTGVKSDTHALVSK